MSVKKPAATPVGEREPLTVRFTQAQLDAVDAEIDLLIGGIPGAKLSRSAFIEPIVLAEVERRRAERGLAPPTESAPAKGRKVAS